MDAMRGWVRERLSSGGVGQWRRQMVKRAVVSGAQVLVPATAVWCGCPHVGDGFTSTCTLLYAPRIRRGNASYFTDRRVRAWVGEMNRGWPGWARVSAGREMDEVAVYRICLSVCRDEMIQGEATIANGQLFGCCRYRL